MSPLDDEQAAQAAQHARDTFDPTLAGYDREEWEHFPDETRDHIIESYLETSTFLSRPEQP